MTDDAAAYRRIPLEIFSEGKIDLIDELFAEDLIEHAAPPGVQPTREALREFAQALRQAFPDFRYEVLHQTKDGDMHLGHVRATGTMKGDFLGMPATGKTATWEEMHLGRMANGKVVEHWAVIDRMGMLQQLGLAPSPPES